ncbi:hypothetical protein K435DRAFT_776750, partial [Dendrothele bispora CBS 962.96]
MKKMYFSLSTVLYVLLDFTYLCHRSSPHIHSLLHLMFRTAFWGVIKGASVKAQDHEISKKEFINSYDFGKMQNLKLIFNTREEG